MVRFTRIQQVVLLGSVLACAGVIMYAVATLNQRQDSRDINANAVSLVDAPTLSSLAMDKTEIDLSHLANGVTPPTNMWFSGFALQKNPEPGYFYPGSFRPMASGFELSLPNVSANATSISAPHTRDLTVVIDGADKYRVTAYDELTVTLTYFNNEVPLADVRLGSGLPYVYVTSRTDELAATFTGKSTIQDNGTLITAAGKVFGLNVPTNTNRFTLSDGATATFFVLSKSADFTTLLSHASSRVKSASVVYSSDTSSVTTEFRYRTSNDQPTMSARLPHQQAKSIDRTPEYSSILGDLQLDTGTTFKYSVPHIKARQSLAVSGLSGASKNQLRTQLRKDVATLPQSPDDTYFGGKQLQRTAQLLDIAAQLGDETSKQTLLKRLTSDLSAWLSLGETSPRSFQYIPEMKGIVGSKPSFGSDTQFNDHHFHYGYFITAAAMLAKYDSGFIKNHGPMVDLLVADIANYKSGEDIPIRRNYDPYAGHSWASGTAPFADGNNQESTSEAINAWSGVANWASVTKNEPLQLEAEWMLSNEYASAQRYWLLRGENATEVPKEYTSPIVSIVWGGKREYATFFSNEANAKLAIQLLPVTPTIQEAGLLLTATELVGTDVTKQYGDAILMVSPGATIDKAQALPDAAIDDGNSRTYLYAYILTRQK